MTGILPIKKLKTQSALNNFDEFTMLDSDILAQYVGFTEKKVAFLFKNMDEIMTKWSIGMTDMCLKIFRFIIREQ